LDSRVEGNQEFRQARSVLRTSQDVVYATFGRANPISKDRDRATHDIRSAKEAVPRSEPNPVRPTVDPTVELTRCFLRLANLPNFALDRLSRYEATLWRQAGRILYALDALDRRKPQERTRRLRIDDRPFGHDQFLIFVTTHHCRVREAMFSPLPSNTRDRGGLVRSSQTHQCSGNGGGSTILM
jgi:hypothetical protein